MLAAASITSLAQLKKLGAVAAYSRVKRSSATASLNLLWALEGALTGLAWQVVARTHRTSLLLALETHDRDAPGPWPHDPHRIANALESPMPLITIKVARREPPLSAAKKTALIAGVTRLMSETLGKRPEDVVVLIEELDPDNWGQGGQSATNLRKARLGTGPSPAPSRKR
jgi:4-oxalocrotonate tautomerase family enzyme